jgi:hypothetical protein
VPVRGGNSKQPGHGGAREHADDDGRAFRPHLAGAKLLGAQQRFLAALLRCPSLWANASRSNITCAHFPSSLRSIFDLATTAPETIRDAVTYNPTVARLYHSPVHLNGGVVLSLGRQIVESVRRAATKRSAAEPANEVAPVPLEVPLAVPTRNAPAEALAPADQTPAPDTSAPDTCKSGVDFTAMADSTSLSDERMDSRASDVQGSDPPAIATAARSLGSKDTVTAFLLAVLADGPLPAREIERMAAREGLLADGKAIGDAKPFRSARQALGIKPFQQSGRKGGGWIWVLPGQAPIHRKPEGG